MRRLCSPARWLAVLATLLPLLPTVFPVSLAQADVAPRFPNRPPSPRIVWQEVKPIEPVLQLARSTGAPMSLTSSDGAGLELVSLSAKAVVEDPLTFTELHLTFRNPEPRVREGQFEIMLPPGAAISRFAMRQGNDWQEGEVVELQAARQAYEDFLHRRQDPALLEKSAGNSFRARVFPIAPSSTKELIVSYSAERQSAADPFRIYLRGLPKLSHLSIRAIVAKNQDGGITSSLGGTSLQHQTVTVEKDEFTPDRDFEVGVPVPSASDGRAVGLQHQNLLVARITPKDVLGKVGIDPLGGVVVLFDTSASRALGYRAQVDTFGAVMAELTRQGEGRTPVRILAFDQSTEEVWSGSIGDVGPAVLERLRSRRALGASDLAQALRAVSQSRGSYRRVLLFSDGVLTAGPTEAPKLEPFIQALRGMGMTRLDAVTVGGLRDEALLRKLTTAGLASDGVVLDGDLPAQAVALRLRRAVRSGIEVSVPGSKWVWPLKLDGVQPGDQVLVYADVPDQGVSQVVLRGREGQSEAVGIATVAVPRPLLERAWVGARIARLMHQRDTVAASDPDLRDGLKHQIIDLSTKFRVMSDFTALLVLETEADYARFHIDRRALTDILGVGMDGIEVRSRKSLAPIAQPQPIQPVIAQPQIMAKRTSTGAPMRPSRAAPASMAKDAAAAAPRRASTPMEIGDSFADTGGAPGGAPGGAASGAVEGGPMGGAAQGVAAAAPSFAPPPPPPPPAPAMERARRMEAPKPVVQERDDAKVMAEERPRAPMMSRPADVPARRMESSSSVLRPIPSSQRPEPIEQPRQQPMVNPYEGKLAEVMRLVKSVRHGEALTMALAWRDSDAGDVLAVIALGEVYEALQQRKAAARAYGSIIDLFPGRADLRRFAGARLERLGDSNELAADTYAKAAANRPDHPSSHRMLAYALLKLGRYDEALEAIVAGATRSYPPGRFAGVPQILGEDVGLIAAAWARKEPQRRDEIERRLQGIGAQLAQGPSVRFVLSWETDANDVDFHILDGRGGHAYYSQPSLPSGGQLYADVTTGYGPECFSIFAPPSQRAYPYKLQAHYYSRGPMGYGMGKLQIIEHDGKGGLRFTERPFVIMVDGAFVDLGEVRGPLP
ncbi:MAG: hypothetical protein JNM40_24010 [Myxococcales bacterium]|nr:hypothetical protein [Myxococcales bacterium]